MAIIKHGRRSKLNVGAGMSNRAAHRRRRQHQCWRGQHHQHQRKWRVKAIPGARRQWRHGVFMACQPVTNGWPNNGVLMVASVAHRRGVSRIALGGDMACHRGISREIMAHRVAASSAAYQRLHVAHQHLSIVKNGVMVNKW